MYQQIDLDLAIQLLQRHRGTPSSETARFTIALTHLIATGQPVSAEKLAHSTGFPIENVKLAFRKMAQSRFEFDDEGNLVGAILTQVPKTHRISVNGHKLYTWCALDTLYVPAYLGQTASITSRCPVTQKHIQVMVAPDGIKSYSPANTALSITMPDFMGSCNIQHGFCNQIHFFSSQDVAQVWAEQCRGIAIFSIEDAYRIAHEVYIKPFMEH